MDAVAQGHAEVAVLGADDPFAGDDERVFVSGKGTAVSAVRFAKTFRAALTRAGIADYVRPFHDLRHSSITNGAAAGMSAASLQRRADHASYSTTHGYINLAGVEFPEETAKLSERLWGASVPKNRSKGGAAFEADADAGEAEGAR